MLANAISFVSSFGIGIAPARLMPPEEFGIIGLAYIAAGAKPVSPRPSLGGDIVLTELLYC